MHPALIVLLTMGAGIVTTWMAWVSRTLISISIAVNGLVVTQDDHDERLNALEALLPRHIPES